MRLELPGPEAGLWPGSWQKGQEVSVQSWPVTHSITVDYSRDLCELRFPRLQIRASDLGEALLELTHRIKESC